MTPLPDARDGLPDGGMTMSRPSIRKLSARGLFGGLVAGSLAALMERRYSR